MGARKAIERSAFNLRRYLPYLCRWLPVICWMAGVFYFSSRPTPLDFTPSCLDQNILGRAAHIAEYTGLTLLVYRAITGGEDEGGKAGEARKKCIRPFVLAGLVSFLYALSDEMHQFWVRERSFALSDIGLDSVGIALAMFLLYLWRKQLFYHTVPIIFNHRDGNDQ